MIYVINFDNTALADTGKTYNQLTDQEFIDLANQTYNDVHEMVADLNGELLSDMNYFRVIEEAQAGDVRSNYELTTQGIDAGAASIFIEKSNGCITVTHGQDKATLYQIQNVKTGSWDKLWDAIKSIESVDAHPEKIQMLDKIGIMDVSRDQFNELREEIEDEYTYMDTHDNLEHLYSVDLIDNKPHLLVHKPGLYDQWVTVTDMATKIDAAYIRFV